MEEGRQEENDEVGMMNDEVVVSTSSFIVHTSSFPAFHLQSSPSCKARSFLSDSAEAKKAE
jgi:hypothetical protein